jgi:hypothetical protein
MCTVGVVRSVYLARCISANVLPLVYREDAKLAKAKAKQMVPEIIHLFDQIDIDAWWKDNDFFGEHCEAHDAECHSVTPCL